MTAESVAAGQDLFLQHCSSCHGQEGRGDGPSAAGLVPPPADLHAAHVDDHDDRQIFLWIRDGFPGSAMSGFKEHLSDQQIWELVNYVRSLRHPIQAVEPSRSTNP
jgi:mono/diheme cytochrome c family protein